MMEEWDSWGVVDSDQGVGGGQGVNIIVQLFLTVSSSLSFSHVVGLFSF